MSGRGEAWGSLEVAWERRGLEQGLREAWGLREVAAWGSLEGMGLEKGLGVNWES